MKKSLLVFTAFLLLFSYSCAKEKPKAAAMPVLKVAVDPIKVQLLEQESLNIPYWVRNGAKDRVLVHISATDGLRLMDNDKVSSVREAAKTEESGRLSKTEDPGYSSLNTVFLAVRLGLVKEVIWVIPALESLTREDADGIRSFLKKTYPGQTSDIEQLRLNGKVLEGRINEVPLKIATLQDIPKTDEAVLLDIDLSFFSHLYLNEKSSRMLQLVSNFFKTLRESGLNADMVTVSASNVDGIVPYKFRFLEDYFAEIFANPGMLDGAPPRLWTERAEAWKMEQRSYKEAIPLYDNILKEYPNDAASRYDLAYAYFKTGRQDERDKELAEAARLDPGYSSETFGE